MITFKSLSLKNFLSTGAVPQVINLDTSDLTLILGDNLDVGGGGAKNGVGKSTMLQALHYVLFNISINNLIKKDNLVNKTNEKGMVVTLDFAVDGVDYQIVRGRKPGVLKFIVGGIERGGGDTSQGENKETQREIERVLNMTPELFTQVALLSTYTQPFLLLKSNEQRVIIESLLGITVLSERADAIKESMRVTRDEMLAEEAGIRAGLEANRRITEQIESLERRQKLWSAKRDTDLAMLQSEYNSLTALDIDAELRAHRELGAWTAATERLRQYEAILARQTAWRQKLDGEIQTLQRQLDTLNAVDISAELAAHRAQQDYNVLVTQHATWTRDYQRAQADCETWASRAEKLQAEVHELEQHRCYACGQEFHDSKHTEVLAAKRAALQEANETYTRVYDERRKLQESEPQVGARPVTHYAKHSDAIKHSSEVERLSSALGSKLGEADPYSEQLHEYSGVVIGDKPRTHYDTEEAAFKHSSRVESLAQQIATKTAESDPYSEQIADMRTRGLVEVSYDRLNQLNRLQEHQKFLHDLLTNRDSFVRKRIIDQNLGYLNGRLQHYLDRLRMNHRVKFKNNLEVEIMEFGRELDPGNLSRGESTRVILALSLAFRDLYENLFHPLNGLYLDEVLDNGLDTAGVEDGVTLLKELTRSRNRSVYLISHREELINRVGTVLRVVKSGGFTSYEWD